MKTSTKKLYYRLFRKGRFMKNTFSRDTAERLKVLGWHYEIAATVTEERGI